ncbi:helix-turn-helix domain-containing protein [Amnibacterium flavum]|uniref:Cro/Cl family transcriptional regulator n=1 Tax=Amnibacterium flavum TaxID=2173173 RepID=A0A2V1HKY6_9MICO|nr:helix-turn-helix domain-containing protein [Amnibacterium flavum]PVZ93283.1 Cro/Cl family transcriptional regulator [Amnibacterium flavum]
MSAATLVKQARRAGGLNRKELSARSGVAQSSLSLLESGQRNPNTDTLERLLAAAGHQLIAIPTQRTDAATTAAHIADSLSDGRRNDAVRHFIQLADNLAAEHDETRFALTISAPDKTGEKRWDAAIAALVEHRLEEEHLPLPRWTRDEARTLTRSWIFGTGLYDIPVERSRVPAAFLRHGVLIDPDTLASI